MLLITAFGEIKPGESTNMLSEVTQPNESVTNNSYQPAPIPNKSSVLPAKPPLGACQKYWYGNAPPTTLALIQPVVAP